MKNQIKMDGIPEGHASADKRKKRNWENAFQKWSDKENQDGYTISGKCGYGSMCDYCVDEFKGRPCVRALNQLIKAKDIKINYSRREVEYFEDIWYGNFKEEIGYLRESIQALQEYCDGQDSCRDCVFRDCRDGYDCKIYELINDERYEEAVK